MNTVPVSGGKGSQAEEAMLAGVLADARHLHPDDLGARSSAREAPSPG